MSNRFNNPNRRGGPSKKVAGDKWGGSTYTGGWKKPDGTGHGHGSKNHKGPARPPVSNWLGNVANNSAGVKSPNQPRW